jgi:predicted MFS family arabinose efflux permease
MAATSLMPMIEHSYSTLIIARSLSGMAGGFLFVIALVYVVEISTKQTQASMGSIILVFLTAGLMAELDINAILATDIHWRLAIAIGSVPAIFLVATIYFMKESPVFYRIKGDTENVKKSIAFYTLEPEDLPLFIEKPGLSAFAKALGQKDFRRQLGMGMILVLSGAIAGQAILIKYGPILLEFFGYQEQSLSLYILSVYAMLGFLVSFLSLIPISRGYAKFILTTSLLVMAIVQLLLSISGGLFSLVLLAILQMAFSFGVRTTVFQLISTLFDDNLRTIGVAFFNLVFILIIGFSGELLPEIFDHLKDTFFVISGFIALVLSVLCFVFLHPNRNNDELAPQN